MTKTYRFNQSTGRMEEVRRTGDRVAPTVFGDMPDYTSPIDGRIVHGRRGRREDLKRSGSRPWEGIEVEKREAARQQAYAEQRSDQRLDETAKRSYYMLSPGKRKILEGR